MDLDAAIAKIESKETNLIDYDSLPKIKDSDIDKMLLNSQERDFKARVWTNLNKQWLVEQKEKKRIKKQEIKARKALKTTHSFASSS